MKSLLVFEYKKILQNRTNRIAMIVGILFSIFLCINWISQSMFYDTAQEKEIIGLEGLQASVQYDNSLTDYLSNEYLKDVLSEYQKRIAVIDPSDENFEFHEGYDYRKILFLVMDVYQPDNLDVDFGRLKEIDTGTSFDFYQERTKRIQEYVNKKFNIGGYSEAEKEFWLNKESNISKPLKWGAKDPWTFLYHVIAGMFFQLLVICICLAPLFSNEYHQRINDIIFSTKYGKSKLITIKIITAITFPIIYLTICVAICLGILLPISGTAGYNLPIQIWKIMAPYPWHICQLTGMDLLIIVLVGVTFGAFSVLLSAKTKSSFATLIICFLIILGPAFLPSNTTNRYYNQIIGLFPIRCIDLMGNLPMYNSYQFGSIIVSDITMTIVAYSIIFILCIIFLKRNYKQKK